MRAHKMRNCDTNTPDDKLTNILLTEPLLENENEAHNDNNVNLNKRNVRNTLWFASFASAGRSLWSSSVLAVFIYKMTNDNAEAVGTLTSIRGVATLLASIPTGIIVDRYRRDIMLKIASVFGMVAIIIASTSSFLQNFHGLALALAMWGLFWGITNTALGALLADSTGEGEERTQVFTQRKICETLGNAAGPIIACVMFAFLEDDWSSESCAAVLIAGQVMSIPAIMIMCFFQDTASSSADDNDTACSSSDDSSNEEEEEQERTTDDSFSFSKNYREFHKQIRGDDCSLACETVQTTASSTVASENIRQEDSSSKTTSEDEDDTNSRCIRSERFIPIFVAMHDVTTGLASGMSISYFPVFFSDETYMNLSPIIVQLLYVIAPMGNALLTYMARSLSLKYGRCHVAVAHKWIGISCMFGLIGAYTHNAPSYVVCMLYVIRTAFMNSTNALTKSLLMDSVPKAERGKWTALESVNQFSWCGSAMIGGFLVTLDGILFNFCITGVMQFCATVPLCILMLSGRVK